MAHDISSQYLQKLELPHYPLMHARIALFPLIRRLRAFVRRACPMNERSISVPVAVTNSFEGAGKQYREQHWTWIEAMFPHDFWKSLVKSWPIRSYFDSPRMITKSYDVGFKWNRGEGVPENIEKFPELAALLTYLQSDAWSTRMKTFSGSEKRITCNSFMANMTYTGSCVIPHRDDPLPANETPFINMIFCIDGTGGGDSGELMLSHDALLTDIFFTPPTLKNACLVYDTEADFYHGFPPVARGKKRWAITASFSPEYTKDS